MTFKALLNMGGFHKEPPSHHHHIPPYGLMDRYHGDSYHDHGYHGSKGKGGGGSGGGAALSALTLLAFLFLINVMQQSLMENNATETTTAATIFLREDQQPIALPAASRDNTEDIVEKDTKGNSNKKEVKKEISYVKIQSSK